MSHGNDALSSGTSVSFASTSRDRGPATTKQPRAPVMLRSRTDPSRRQPLLQVVGVVALGRPGAHDVELLVGQLRDRELRADAAALRQRVAKRMRPIFVGTLFATSPSSHAVGARSARPRAW